MKQDFFDLLSEQHIEVGQRWSKVKDRLETDPRYKAVESSALREELFKQYMEKQAKVRATCGLEIAKNYTSQVQKNETEEQGASLVSLVQTFLQMVFFHCLSFVWFCKSCHLVVFFLCNGLMSGTLKFNTKCNHWFSFAGIVESCSQITFTY